MKLPIEVNVDVVETQHHIGVECAGGSRAINANVAAQLLVYPPYEGPLTIIPTDEDQILDTSLKTMRGNLVVKAIPQNYGLISWNGSYLTIT